MAHTSSFSLMGDTISYDCLNHFSWVFHYIYLKASFMDISRFYFILGMENTQGIFSSKKYQRLKKRKGRDGGPNPKKHWCRRWLGKKVSRIPHRTKGKR
jgi:hypothetical protein